MQQVYPEYTGNYGFFNDLDFMSRDAGRFFLAGSVFAFIGVAAGAFGAHGLRDTLPADLLEVFETAARYQMYHSFALLVAAILISRWPSRAAVAAGWLFTVGILIFSGSLYLLALTGIRWLGAITPLGGVAFLAGWSSLGLAGWRAGSAVADHDERPRNVGRLQA